MKLFYKFFLILSCVGLLSLSVSADVLTISKTPAGTVENCTDFQIQASKNDTGQTVFSLNLNESSCLPVNDVSPAPGGNPEGNGNDEEDDPTPTITQPASGDDPDLLRELGTLRGVAISNTPQTVYVDDEGVSTPVYIIEQSIDNTTYVPSCANHKEILRDCVPGDNWDRGATVHDIWAVRMQTRSDNQGGEIQIGEPTHGGPFTVRSSFKYVLASQPGLMKSDFKTVYNSSLSAAARDIVGNECETRSQGNGVLSIVTHEDQVNSRGLLAGCLIPAGARFYLNVRALLSDDCSDQNDQCNVYFKPSGLYTKHLVRF